MISAWAHQSLDLVDTVDPRLRRKSLDNDTQTKRPRNDEFSYFSNMDGMTFIP